jgi:hypothetical protein
MHPYFCNSINFILSYIGHNLGAISDNWHVWSISLVDGCPHEYTEWYISFTTSHLKILAVSNGVEAFKNTIKFWNILSMYQWFNRSSACKAYGGTADIN